MFYAERLEQRAALMPTFPVDTRAIIDVSVETDKLPMNKTVQQAKTYLSFEPVPVETELTRQAFETSERVGESNIQDSEAYKILFKAQRKAIPYTTPDKEEVRNLILNKTFNDAAFLARLPKQNISLARAQKARAEMVSGNTRNEKDLYCKDDSYAVLKACSYAIALPYLAGVAITHSPLALFGESKDADLVSYNANLTEGEKKVLLEAVRKADIILEAQKFYGYALGTQMQNDIRVAKIAANFLEKGIETDTERSMFQMISEYNDSFVEKRGHSKSSKVKMAFTAVAAAPLGVAGLALGLTSPIVRGVSYLTTGEAKDLTDYAVEAVVSKAKIFALGGSGGY